MDDDETRLIFSAPTAPAEPSGLSGPGAALRAELISYRGTYPVEAPTVDRFVSFVMAHPDAFSRSCIPGHVTGSAFLATPDFGKVLFVHHRKLGKWLQPGGHCESGESASVAAMREAYEETGLRGVPGPWIGIFDVDIHSIPAAGGAPAHEHFDVRYLLVAAEEAPRPSEESLAAEWLTLEEAERRNGEPSILRPLSKLRSLSAGLESRGRHS